MPIGAISNMPALILDLRAAILNVPRAKIADVGMGFGIYGAAIRQWIDFGYADGGRWKSYIQGVEGFDRYRNPVWDLYDYVYVMEIEEWIPMAMANGDRYHGILFNDVIEHMERAHAANIIRDLKKLLEPYGRLYISTPGFFFKQDVCYGNPREKHVSFWTLRDLEEMGFRVLVDPNSGLRYDGQAPDAFGVSVLSAVYTYK